MRPLEGGFERWQSLGFPTTQTGQTQTTLPPSNETEPPVEKPDTPSKESAEALPLAVSARLCPELPLPTSGFLPGIGMPRPEERDFSGGPWTAENWKDIQPWKFGIDLYNAGFFWEAHEAWEAVWTSWPKDSPEGLLVRGCIQSAAALVKLRGESLAGVKKLSTRSLETLGQATREAPEGTLLGLDLGTLRSRFETYWLPLEQGDLPALLDFPRIELG